MATEASGAIQVKTRDRFTTIFRVFLGLGLTSFGGPTAHIGYFKKAFVDDRRWLSAESFAGYFAFANVLPGPTSSQLGLAIGLHRGGLAGGAAAFLGFTAPSALLMLLAGLAGYALLDGGGWLAGLMAAAVAVVTHAVWTMAKGLCPDTPRRLVAVVGFLLTVVLAGSLGQFATLGTGALAGLFWLKLAASGEPFDAVALPGWLSTAAGWGFALCLLLVAVVPWFDPGPAVGTLVGMLHAGSFIFGGGHVVLPLLQTQLVDTGYLGSGPFLAGYALAQAVPGPMFTIAAYLGAASPVGSFGFGLLAMLALFLPSFLLVFAVLPYWQTLQQNSRVRRTLAGMGAAVVGLLAAMLVTTLIPKAITGFGTLAVALLVLAALFSQRVPAWLTVLGAAASGAMLNALGWLEPFAFLP